MEKTIPRYQRPLASLHYPVVNIDHWNNAYDAFGKNEYRKSVIELINYINPSVLKEVDITKDISIVKQQGSAQIHIDITQTEFKIKAPFLKITESTNKVALLRKIAEVNFYPLTLTQIYLNDHVLWFGYQMPLSLCQPYKVYDLLYDICVYADQYDEEFIEKYKADFIYKPNITELSSAEKEKLWQQINTIFEDYKDLSKFFTQKQWNVFQWDCLVVSFLQFANMPYLHGNLKSKIAEQIYNIYDSRQNFNVRVDRGIAFMYKLMETSKEDILKNMYHSEILLSVKWSSSDKVVKEEMGAIDKQVQDYLSKEDFYSLCYLFQYSFLKLMFEFNLEEKHKNMIWDALEGISGMQPKEACVKLLATYNSFLKGETEQPKQKSKGFFSKLFNN